MYREYTELQLQCRFIRHIKRMGGNVKYMGDIWITAPPENCVFLQDWYVDFANGGNWDIGGFRAQILKELGRK